MSAAYDMYEPKLREAIRRINGDDGVTVHVKPKQLSKFGTNEDIGTTRETVSQIGGLETYATGNDIDTISSSSLSDTENMVIEGHTISNGVMTFVVQSKTLQGQTETTLDTPLYRATRIYNNDSSNTQGDVYVYESGGTVTAGVPQTTADIHLKIPIEFNQSQKLATSFSSLDYFIITQITLGVGRSSGNSRTVDADLEVREYGKVFRRRFPITGNNQAGLTVIDLNPCIIVKPRSDMRMTAISSGSGTQVRGSIRGYLALINS